MVSQHVETSRQGTPSQSSDDLHDALDRLHREIDARLRTARDTLTDGADHRDIVAACDTFLAVASRHIAAVEDTLLRQAQQTLPDGHHRVGRYLHGARELEFELHMIKAAMYGDVNARHVDLARLWDNVESHVSRQRAIERTLADDLQPQLNADQIAELIDRLATAEEHAPTRPHPFTPQTGVTGRIAHRIWALADRLWDNAEGRTLPATPKPLNPRRNSLLSRYVLGSPVDQRVTRQSTKSRS